MHLQRAAVKQHSLTLNNLQLARPPLVLSPQISLPARVLVIFAPLSHVPSRGRCTRRLTADHVRVGSRSPRCADVPPRQRPRMLGPGRRGRVEAAHAHCVRLARCSAPRATPPRSSHDGGRCAVLQSPQQPPLVARLPVRTPARTPAKRPPGRQARATRPTRDQRGQGAAATRLRARDCALGRCASASSERASEREQ
jgi:hypothetical protein